MSDLQQYSLSESSFVPELRFGCIQIENADRLPLDWANFVPQPGHVTLALGGATRKPRTEDSFVAINSFQFPEGNSEFDRVVEWFGQDRKSRAKLPDGVKFDQSVLAVQDAPPDWEHDAYPQSNRAFVHIHRAPKQAVLIRWLARTGTILDHPLFHPLVTNLRIVPGQWITAAPSIRPKTDRQPEITGAPLTEAVRNEIEASAAGARVTLQLGQRPRSPQPFMTQLTNCAAVRPAKQRRFNSQSPVDLSGDRLCATPPTGNGKH